MEENNEDNGKTLEEIMNHMGDKKKRPRVDYHKFAPIGWQRLTDEQRKVIQQMINHFLEKTS